MLSLAFYFSGSFAQALHLLNQLIAPDSPLDKKQINGLEELTGYARLELLRQDYWDGLKLERPEDIELELKKRNWKPSSLEAFHLYLSNGLASDWLNLHSLDDSNVLVRAASRNDQVRIFRECVDTDMCIGSHIEAVRGFEYLFIPFGEIRSVEMGPLKRWIRASVQYRDGSWVEMRVPLMHRDSMLDGAPGVKEVVETVLRPSGEEPNWKQAFGQKQYRSSSGMMVGLAEISTLEMEITNP